MSESVPSDPSGDSGPADTTPVMPTVERFFRGLAESIFHAKLGVADIQLVDYLGDMLLRFTRTDAMYRVRRSNGQPALEVFEMLREAEKRIGLARREVHRHIGDFTLFWIGMYPESFRAVKSDPTDPFLNYCDQGKRAYRIASEIDGGSDRPPCEVLSRLSDEFEMCAYGLREVRREWEEGETAGGTGLVV